MFKALAHLLLATAARGERETKDREPGELQCDYVSVGSEKSFRPVIVH
jgi:hypothetical protein